jgi:hypothetical protein
MLLRFLLGLSCAVSFFLPTVVWAHSDSQDQGSPQPHSTPASAKEHSHRQIEIPKGHAIPTVELRVIPDSMRGWNVHIQTQNFVFAPEDVNQGSQSVSQAPNQPVKGHAHLFVNGQKLTRLYGPWYYLESLPSGHNELRVTLATNQHEDLVYQGNVIETSVMVTVP